jgi:hypothetical protein
LRRSRASRDRWQPILSSSRKLETFAVEPRPLALDGLSIELPVGWDGFAKRLEVDESPAVYAANVPWPDVGQNFEQAPAGEQFERLPPDGVVVSAVLGPLGVDPGVRARKPPLELADGYFLADTYEGQPAPRVSTQIISGRAGDRFLYVQVFFGRNDPDETMRAEANAVLATLRVSAQPAIPPPAGWRQHRAPELGRKTGILRRR